MRVDSKSFVEVEWHRRRVAIAKSLSEEARKQAKAAKVRRKLAKLLARRAAEAAEQAKARLAEAKEDLARAEAIVSSGHNGRADNRNNTKPKRIARSLPKSPQKKTAARPKARKLAGAKVAASAPAAVSMPMTVDPV